MKMPVSLKIFLSWALIGLALCIMGVSTVTHHELQAVLKPLAVGWMLLLVPFGIVWIWKQ